MSRLKVPHLTAARRNSLNAQPRRLGVWVNFGGTGDEGLAANVPEGYTGARYSDTVLFIDARHIYRQIDRAHRDWTDAQIGFLANRTPVSRQGA